MTTTDEAFSRTVNEAIGTSDVEDRFQASGFVVCHRDAGIGKKRNAKLNSWFAVCVLEAIFATIVFTVSAEEPTASATPSVSDTEDDTTKEADFPSPDEKFAFLIGRGEDQQTIDLIDKKRKSFKHR